MSAAQNACAFDVGSINNAGKWIHGGQPRFIAEHNGSFQFETPAFAHAASKRCAERYAAWAETAELIAKAGAAGKSSKYPWIWCLNVLSNARKGKKQKESKQNFLHPYLKLS